MKKRKSVGGCGDKIRQSTLGLTVPSANEAIAGMEEKYHESVKAPFDTAIEKRKSYRQCSLAFE